MVLKYICIGLGIFWSNFVIVRLIYGFICNPFGFFRRVKHKKSNELIDSSEWTHKYLQLKDLKIHYVEAGSADKPLMLFVHGFPEFWYSWRHQLREFKKDYRVVALDQRGYGESDKPAGYENYNMRHLTGDLRDLIQGLGNDKCILVGHDWGGAVSWAFTYMYPQMVDKLIIMNCPHGAVFKKFMLRHFSQFLKSWYMFFFQIPWLPEFFIGTDDYNMFDVCFGPFDKKSEMGMTMNPMTKQDVENYKYTFSQSGALSGPINYYRAAFQTPPVKVGKIEPPTLVLWGDRDLALDEGMASMSVELCRQGTVKLINGSSHWVQQDAPEQVHKYMREFLTSKKMD